MPVSLRLPRSESESSESLAIESFIGSSVGMSVDLLSGHSATRCCALEQVTPQATLKRPPQLELEGQTVVRPVCHRPGARAWSFLADRGPHGP
mmetsp:Transcript_64388/g.143868  ORF Transcript_64388/g.143868 Transcript_64388/m.143868 type:complete len:93 (+) Transcript_64388:540-818(+)